MFQVTFTWSKSKLETLGEIGEIGSRITTKAPEQRLVTLSN